MKELQKLREKIDQIDREILRLLNERSRLALEIGRLKRRRNARAYSPERERQIIERLLGANPGPFPNDALRSIYREIISASRALEEPLRVACLGPLATFTHLAALRHFGSSAQFVPVESIRDVFEQVRRGGADYGVVPVENSNEGVVSYTLDMFMDYELKVSAEVMLEVVHNLLSREGKAKKVRYIYSHPQAAAQCRGWLEQNMPGVPIRETTSTAKAAELASRDPQAAAIASEAAAQMYDLRFIARHIEDRAENVTRFLVIGNDYPSPTGKDKTSVMFSIKDRPGALYDILAPFKRAKINLTKIESRPSRRRAWEYIFFVDLEGHIQEARVMKALQEVKKHCLFFKHLGSYPAGEA
jgi:chorismate mutase/prephenate dehydratase